MKLNISKTLRVILLALVPALLVLLLWNLYTKDFQNIAGVEPELYLDAKSLLAHFKNGNQTLLKPESVVEIKGAIKEINTLNDRFTIVLEGEGNNSSGILCDMQANQNKYMSTLSPKDTILIKGVFKGFLKDAIFLNCVISDRKNQ